MADSPLLPLLLAYGARLPHHPGKEWVHDKLRRGLRIEAHGERLVGRDGLKWHLSPDDPAQAGLFWLGVKDRWELDHVAAHLRPDSVIIDAGANYGYHALSLARRLGGKCTVHAIEPFPENFARLQRHVGLNGRGACVTCHAYALSDTTGTCGMAPHPVNSGHAHVSKRGTTPPIAMTTLDVFSADQGLDRVDCLLIDVEGLEAAVIRGAGQTIARHHPLILIEMFTPVLRHHASGVPEVASLLRDLGYHFYEARKERLMPVVNPSDSDVRTFALAFHASALPAPA